jgi:parvulin-like peptidyl-prolyl isomerase
MMRSLKAFLLLALLVTGLAAAEGNRILIRVNDRIGTLHDYEVRRDDRLRALQNADMDPARRAELSANAGTEVLNDMLEELLVLSRADQIGFNPDAREIDDAVRRAMESFGITSDEEFDQALAQTGMTREAFRKQVEVNLRVSSVMNSEVQKRVELTEEDGRRYYYEHEDEFTLPERKRLREIVVLESSSLSADQRTELAGEIIAEVGSGVAMEDIAAKHQPDGMTSGVVDLGWVEKGDLDFALEQAIETVDAGELSEPVAARGGLHIVAVLEREEAQLQSFAEVGERINAIERERLFREEYAEFMHELRTRAYISIRELPPDVPSFDVQQSLDRLVFESEFDPDQNAPLESLSTVEDSDGGS